MFTGIVHSLGAVTQIEAEGGDLRVGIAAASIERTRLQLGASVAVAGVCLTVAVVTPSGFAADVSRESLSLTTIGQWRVGESVNLEAALRAGDALGGHWVSGHVDGCATCLERAQDARSVQMRFAVPAELARYIARKGSVALDGVSLTINQVDAAEFTVNLIPHTLSVTTLGNLSVGGQVNLEIDVIARYAERLLGATWT